MMITTRTSQQDPTIPRRTAGSTCVTTLAVDLRTDASEGDWLEQHTPAHLAHSGVDTQPLLDDQAAMGLITTYDIVSEVDPTDAYEQEQVVELDDDDQYPSARGSGGEAVGLREL